MFVSSSSVTLEEAEPVGALTAKDRETLNLVLKAGGTVTAMEFATRMGVEQTTAGNRLVSLHKKGYLQRLVRPHPLGDLFIDARSIRFPDGPKYS
jgi:predicted transcriptional regulator